MLSETFKVGDLVTVYGVGVGLIIAKLDTPRSNTNERLWRVLIEEKTLLVWDWQLRIEKEET